MGRQRTSLTSASSSEANWRMSSKEAQDDSDGGKASRNITGCLPHQTSGFLREDQSSDFKVEERERNEGKGGGGEGGGRRKGDIEGKESRRKSKKRKVGEIGMVL